MTLRNLRLAACVGGGMRRLLVLLVALMLAGCMPGASPTTGGADGTLEIELVAGPVCPVERDPPDPACEPRAVVGAPILVQPGDGRDIVVAQATTDERGRARFALPAGVYVVVAGDLEGLLGRPGPAMVTIVAGQLSGLQLAYDTGIR